MLQSPIRKSRRGYSYPSSNAAEDPFLAALAEAEKKDARAHGHGHVLAVAKPSLKVPRPLAALETAQSSHDAATALGLMPTSIIDCAPRLGPITRSATRITPLLGSLAIRGWPQRHGGGKEATGSCSTDVPALSRPTAPMRVASAAKKVARAAVKVASKPLATGGKKARGSSSGNQKPKQKKPSSGKGLRVAYTLPGTSEVVYVTSSQLTELSGVQYKNSAEMKRSLDHIMATM